MADHQDLVSEMASVEKMSTQERLKHAKKRRAQQLKKFANYDKALEKESSKRKKYGGSSKRKKNEPQSRGPRIRFPGKIVLLEAAARNDIDDVRKLLTQGVNPNSTNEDGLTALHQCCIDDSEEMLKLLLEFGANVNAQDSELWTPLHAAATCGHVHLCKHLIDKGANLLAVNADGNMPYDICEDEVTLDYIETEMARRGITQEEIDETRLIPEKTMLKDMQYLIDHRGNLEYFNHEGTTPLHIAAANGYLEVGKLLLEHHVSLETRDSLSWQPIHAAACWLQPEFLELLVKHGADIDAKTRNNETPFDLCEDAEIKQKILDMKDEIENNKLSNSRGSVKRHKHNTRSASIRRTSMRGEKNPLFMKEKKEEALHFGWNKDDDDDLLEEDKENFQSTNIDDVELIIDDDGQRQNNSSLLMETSLNGEVEPDSFVQKLSDTLAIHGASKTSDSGRTVNNGSSNPNQATENLHPAGGTKVVKRHSFTRRSEMVNKSNSSPERDQNQRLPTQPEEPSTPAGPHVRYPSGTPSVTLSDLKKHRQESRTRNNSPPTIDTQVQDLFLSSLNTNNKKYSSSSLPGREEQNHKNKNGHNNNVDPYTNNAQPIRRFVAPSSAPVVGGEEKKGCCVIL